MPQGISFHCRCARQNDVQHAHRRCHKNRAVFALRRSAGLLPRVQRGPAGPSGTRGPRHPHVDPAPDGAAEIRDGHWCLVWVAPFPLPRELNERSRRCSRVAFACGEPHPWLQPAAPFGAVRFAIRSPQTVVASSRRRMDCGHSLNCAIQVRTGAVDAATGKIREIAVALGQERPETRHQVVLHEGFKSHDDE